MKYLFYVLTWLLLVSPQGAQAQSFVPPSAHLCDRATSGSAVQQIATAVASVNIYVCGYAIDATASAATFTLAYGTGTNCGTGTTNVSPAFIGSGQGSAFVDHGTFSFVTLPAGQNLCVVSANNSTYAVYWGQY
jgi:hypothetical protein